MQQSELDAFKAKLLQMQAELEGLKSDSKEAAATVVLDQSSVGRLSRMDAMQGQQMALESARRRTNQLLQIKAALQRIDRDDFGYCAKCDEEISIGRLSINPAVLFCLRCSE